ncbi:MAG: hypothetical protein NTY19_42825 [Planctomycetota bacterium]|nr:hypothetical protein [Planctomycetota bacterium]
MAKYYVESGWVRLVLDARTPRDAAVKAIQWCHDRQADVFAEPADDRIREAEILEWQLDGQIAVNETGFRSHGGKIFDTVELAAVRERVVRRT